VGDEMRDSISIAKKVANIVKRPVLLTDMMGNVQFTTEIWDKTNRMVVTKETSYFVEEPYHFFELKDAQHHYLVLDLENPLTDETLALLTLFLSSSEEASKEDQLLKNLLLGDKYEQIGNEFNEILLYDKNSQWTLIGLFKISPENMTLLKKTISHFLDEVWWVELTPTELIIIVRKKDSEALAEAFQLRDIIVQEVFFDPIICISHNVGKIEHIYKAYDHLLKLFNVVNNESSGIYFFEDYLFEIFMDDVESNLVKGTYIELYGKFEKVLEDHELLLTINTFIEENLNINETSRRLYIHRNTLIYRINKILEMTSLDLRHFHDALKMSMILKMKKLVDEED
jgi:carbohydrate diacid regulator